MARQKKSSNSLNQEKSRFRQLGIAPPFKIDEDGE
jgi:hypothetical protein